MASKAFERLRRVAGRQTLKLTHYGRKSGRPYEVVIWFLVEGDRMYLISANKSRSWVRNVKMRPDVSLRVGEEIFNGNVRPVTDAHERDHINNLAERKYWFVMSILRIGRLLMASGIMRDNTATFEVFLSEA